jgi:hypothetical protein
METVANWFAAFFRAIWPPHDLNREHLIVWARTVSLIIGGLVMALSFYVAWAYGALASFGLSGYALASDFSTARQQITEIQVSQLETEMDRAHMNQCQIVAASKMPGADIQILQKALYQEMISFRDKNAKYRAIVNRDYETQPCDVTLLIAGKG